jgi:hypothetical protein
MNNTFKVQESFVRQVMTKHPVTLTWLDGTKVTCKIKYGWVWELELFTELPSSYCIWSPISENPDNYVKGFVLENVCDIKIEEGDIWREKDTRKMSVELTGDEWREILCLLEENPDYDASSEKVIEAIERIVENGER